MNVNIPGFKQPDSCKSCSGVVYKEIDGSIKKLTCKCLILQRAFDKLGSDLFSHLNLKNTKINSLVKSELMSDKIFLNFKNIESLKKVLAHFIFLNNIKSFIQIDSYRIMDIYFGQDEEFKNSRELYSKNNFIVLNLGDTEISNVKLDEVVGQFIQWHNSFSKKILWVVSKYSKDSNELKKWYSTKTIPLLNSKEFKSFIL